MRRPLVDTMVRLDPQREFVLTARREALNQAVVMETERGGPFSTVNVLRQAEEFERWLLRGLNE